MDYEFITKGYLFMKGNIKVNLGFFAFISLIIKIGIY